MQTTHYYQESTRTDVYSIRLGQWSLQWITVAELLILALFNVAKLHHNRLATQQQWLSLVANLG